MEQNFLRRYGDRGLRVVALDAHDGPEVIDGVRAFVDKLGVTYPTGLEQTETYRALTANFEGTNPFPVDVIIDRDGKIVYIAREYDPEAMAEIIERLLDD